jgi:hypothetical protein
MLRSSFLSSTSVLLLTACPSPDPTCGVGTITASTLGASGGGDTLTYGEWRASNNNDCPDPNAPTDVVSVTINAAQTSPPGTASVGLCLPRPDLVAETGEATLTLGSADLQVTDVQGALGGANCRWHDARNLTGTAHLTGFCGADHPDGFAIAITGTATVTRSCDGAADEDVTVTLSGAAPGHFP